MRFVSWYLDMPVHKVDCNLRLDRYGGTGTAGLVREEFTSRKSSRARASMALAINVVPCVVAINTVPCAVAIDIVPCAVAATVSWFELNWKAGPENCGR